MGDRTTRTDPRVEAILRAAIPVFASQGFARTSMANIAKAVGCSRPALYQYFDNRSDLFGEAFRLLLDEATDAAIAALETPGPLAGRIDGYLQRLSGDGYEALAATPFGEELMEARHQFAADAADGASARARDGLRAHIERVCTADRCTRNDVVDLITLSPVGLKSDKPTPNAYRHRLRILAHSAAAALADTA